MKKKNKRKITILALLVLIVSITCFIVSYIQENKTQITENIENDIKTTITTGKNLKLPEIYTELNIKLPENDIIISNSVKENLKTNTKSYSVSILTTKNINELAEFYKNLLPNSMSTENNETIISGDSNNIIKLKFNNSTYEITIEKR